MSKNKKYNYTSNLEKKKALNQSSSIHFMFSYNIYIYKEKKNFIKKNIKSIHFRKPNQIYNII